MVKIGVQTRGILPDVSISKGMHLIADAGFDCVDFNLDSFFDKTVYEDNFRNTVFDFSINDLKLFFGQYKAEMDACGLTAHQVHAPFPIWGDLAWEQNDYVQQNVIPKSIIIAGLLGAKWMVIHPVNMHRQHGIDNEKKFNIEYLQSLIPLLKQTKVGICIENMHSGVGGRHTEGMFADPEEAIYYVDTLNEIAGEELFGVCLDTGHLQVSKRNVPDYIRRVGKRLKALHLHENNGVDDLHQMPFTFGYDENDGLNWEEISKALKETGYEGALCFETHPCMRAFPDEILLPALQTICAIGQYMKSEME